MRVRVTAVRINETGQRVRPPFPVDITSLFEIDHSSATVVYREVQVEELYPLWGGLDMALDEVALTEEGKPDVTVEFRIFQTAQYAESPSEQRVFTSPAGSAFDKAVERLRNLNIKKVEEDLANDGYGRIVVSGPDPVRVGLVQMSLHDILPGVGFRRHSGAPFAKCTNSPWSQHTATHGGIVGPGKRKKGKRKKGKKK